MTTWVREWSSVAVGEPRPKSRFGEEMDALRAYREKPREALLEDISYFMEIVQEKNDEIKHLKRKRDSAVDKMRVIAWKTIGQGGALALVILAAGVIIGGIYIVEVVTHKNTISRAEREYELEQAVQVEKALAEHNARVACVPARVLSAPPKGSIKVVCEGDGKTWVKEIE